MSYFKLLCDWDFSKLSWVEMIRADTFTSIYPKTATPITVKPIDIFKRLVIKLTPIFAGIYVVEPRGHDPPISNGIHSILQPSAR